MDHSIVPINRFKFPYVCAWGALLGSHDYYVANELRQAHADHAGMDAIYKRDNGTWATVKDVQSEDTVDYLHKFVKEMLGKPNDKKE